MAKLFCKQWRTWSDVAFCGVCSGSALFVNYPFRGLPTTMGSSELVQIVLPVTDNYSFWISRTYKLFHDRFPSTKVTVFNLITAHTPISAQSSNFVVFRLQSMCLYLSKSICCGYTFDLARVNGWENGSEQGLNPSFANHDMPCLSKQCRSRSAGFWRSQLIWICTVCHLICEFLSQTKIK